VARHGKRIVELRDGEVVRDSQVTDRLFADDEMVRLGMNTAAGVEAVASGSEVGL
jgi:hypothetical protein